MGSAFGAVIGLCSDVLDMSEDFGYKVEVDIWVEQNGFT
jgi:hypothetical protein